MEGRASILPGLPRQNPTSSYWQDPPSRLAQQQGNNDQSNPKVFPTKADVVVIGSGITGAALAHYFLETRPSSVLVMLEARTACSGATGRNGGHTKTHSYPSFRTNCKTMGEIEAAKIVRFKYACMRAMHAFAREHNIQCDSWEGDTVDIFYNEWHFAEAKRGIEKMREVLGFHDEAAQFEIWEADKVEERFKTKGACGAVSYATGSMSGYRFVTGILELVLAKGMDLWTETPALSLERTQEEGPGQWAVKTTRGTIKANQVVLATNGYTAHLCPMLQGIIVPLRGHMTAQRPGTGLPIGSLDTTFSFIYDDGYEYMITRPKGSKFAGDICIGGGSTKAQDAGLMEFGTTDDTTINPAILSYLEDSAKKYFGDHWGQDNPEGRLRQAWTGIMGYSADGFPLVGQVPDNEGLYISASFQGSGMIMSLLSAKALSLIMNGRDDAAFDKWFPKAFRMGKHRLSHKFQGRLHSTAPKDCEIKAQTVPKC